MSTTADKLLTPAACLDAMQAFWRENIEVAPVRDGLAVALPLMYPDGWQVTIHLSSLTPGWARISDQGKTLGMLLETGMSLKAKHTAALLQERIAAFELTSDGAVISKDMKLPLQGMDVQLFAEALVSIAHLVYRHEPSAKIDDPADKTVRRMLEKRRVAPRRNVEIPGHLLKGTRVDYLVEAKRPVAIQVVGRRDDLLDYMERWAFRWDDMRKQNGRLVAGMVYNPENQIWDDISLRIGREVCDVFCRYDEITPLGEVLDRAGA